MNDQKIKIIIKLVNNKNIKTSNCKSCDTWCQPNIIYCILYANRLGLCQKCKKKFDNTMYKYSDLKWKDYNRKRRTKKISTDINYRLIKKMKLDKLRPKQENKKKKSSIKITNFNFNSIDLKESENEENLNKKENL